MRLQFIGVGAAIKTTHHGASAVVNGHILIDTPPACNALLRRYALLVDTIFITHLHGDHLGGLPFLLLEKYVDNNMKTLHIYGPDGLEEKIRLYFEAMFSELDVVKYPIFDSVRFHVVEPEVEIELCGLSVKPVLGRHAITSFGYVFRDDHVCVYFSGDTELCEPVLKRSMKPIAWSSRERKKRKACYTYDGRGASSYCALLSGKDVLYYASPGL